MDEKELQTALAKAIRGIIYDQTNHDVSVGTLEEEVKIIILPLLAQPAAQTPASALREAAEEMRRCILDNIDVPGTEWLDRPMKSWLDDWKQALAAAPQISEAEQHRNECENCGRSMVGENAVCLTCWNRVAAAAQPDKETNGK